MPSGWVADETAPPEMQKAHYGGVAWWKATPHRPWQPHRAQTRAYLHGVEYIERCSCGAFGPAPWTMLDPPRERPTRLQRLRER